GIYLELIRTPPWRRDKPVVPNALLLRRNLSRSYRDAAMIVRFHSRAIACGVLPGRAAALPEGGSRGGRRGLQSAGWRKSASLPACARHQGPTRRGQRAHPHIVAGARETWV